MMFSKINNHFLTPFEDVGHSVESFNNVSSVSLMSVPDLMTILFTNSDHDDTPVGNNGLAQERK